MSRLFDAYYFSPSYEEQEFIRRKKEDELWEQWETEKANELFTDQPSLFVLQDGTVLIDEPTTTFNQ